MGMARLAVAWLAFGLLATPVAQARVAYDNFLPDGSFFRIGWTVLHAPLPHQLAIEQAESFRAWNSGTAVRLVAALGHAQGAQGVLLELHADDHGRMGRRIGRGCRLATNAHSVGMPGAAVSASLAGYGWRFKAGGTYWLRAVGTRGSDHAWQLNLAGARGLRRVWDSREPGPWYGEGVQGAFRIELAPFSGVFG